MSMPAERDALRRRTRPPLEPGRGAGFITQMLVREGQALAYRPTPIARAFSGVFRYLGYAALAGSLIQIAFGQWIGFLAFLGGGSLFVGIGRHLARFFSAGVRFDPLTRRIEIPGRPPLWLLVKERQAITRGFDEVAEIEIIKKDLFTGDISDAINYELNLVLKAGERINIVSHINDDLILQEATTLSRMIGVGVFDGRKA